MPVPSPSEVCAALSRHRVRIKPERHMQADVGEVLTRAGWEFEAERIMSPEDRPDFFITGGIVIECKSRVKDKMAVYRQIARYCLLPEVSAVILFTGTPMGLPGEIHGKPTFYVSAGAAWV